MAEKKKSEESTFVDDIGRETDKVAEIAYYLKDLSSALLRTGNEQLGQELDAFSVILLEAQKKIGKAIGKEVHRQVVRAGDSSRAMVEAALSGIVEASKQSAQGEENPDVPQRSKNQNK